MYQNLTSHFVSAGGSHNATFSQNKLQHETVFLENGFTHSTLHEFNFELQQLPKNDKEGSKVSHGSCNFWSKQVHNVHVLK
jgi:hypothetical protein